ncbi:hypothetical protein LOTGIDRAFT_162155 [Lottia gigantea]|uniref:Uncharacterized protein n=1 Tax=Lottia gigantea TaxID=225164 RepID=V3ZP13_LOTGI|nr:hypothetical protein LOTGIDRAFT_162155 [Lottia gigantea]ESO93128.1 hypothetical protein LOTGIDRAFT_162155 [Lottia gigantea]
MTPDDNINILDRLVNANREYIDMTADEDEEILDELMSQNKKHIGLITDDKGILYNDFNMMSVNKEYFNSRADKILDELMLGNRKYLDELIMPNYKGKIGTENKGKVHQNTEYKGKINDQGTEYKGKIYDRRTEYKGKINDQGTENKGKINDQGTEYKGKIYDRRTEYKGKINDQGTSEQKTEIRKIHDEKKESCQNICGEQKVESQLLGDVTANDRDILDQLMINNKEHIDLIIDNKDVLNELINDNKEHIGLTTDDTKILDKLMTENKQHFDSMADNKFLKMAFRIFKSKIKQTIGGYNELGLSMYS